MLPTLCEWEVRSFEGVRLSAVDRQLVGRLGAGGEGRLQIDELRDGLRVRARSWVGVVRLETVEIRIVPKLAGYIEREEDLGLVRGRILADRQIMKRFGRLDRIICRFDELEHDIDENRLLVAAMRVAARRVRTASVHRRIARLRTVLEPICDPSGLDLPVLRREIRYNRLNAHYERAHALAWLVLDALGIDDLLASGSTRSFAFLLDMNLLFERFVERLVERVLDPHRYRVDSQVVHTSILWNAVTSKPYALGSRGAGTGRAALLLYPASSAEGKVIRLKVRSLSFARGAEIVGLGIPIPTAVAELESGRAGTVQRAIRAAIAETLEGSFRDA